MQACVNEYLNTQEKYPISIFPLLTFPGLFLSSCPSVSVIHVYRWKTVIFLRANAVIQGLPASDMQRR